MRKNTIFLLVICFLCLTLYGCEAFMRKFSRKPKKEKLPKEEIVLIPERYLNQDTPEDIYRRYFLFWKSWHEELINSLSSERSNKKQLQCLKEAIDSLLNLRELLRENKQQELDKYIEQLKNLRLQIENDPYAHKTDFHRIKAENLKRNILRDFSYTKVKSELK